MATAFLFWRISRGFTPFIRGEIAWDFKIRMLSQLRNDCKSDIVRDITHRIPMDGVLIQAEVRRLYDDWTTKAVDYDMVLS